MEFRCKSCDYLTTNQSNYRKHLRTDKHKRKENLQPVIQSVTQPILSDKSESTFEIQKSTTKLAKISPKLAEVSPKLAEVSPKVLECKYCLQQFKHKSSLSKHIKYTCMKNKDEDLKELVRLLNLQLETEREERKKVQKQVENQAKQVENQAKQIEKLMDKLAIHGSFNNNTIHVNLLAYRDSDMSHLTPEDYRNCYKKVNHCVKHLIEKVHFNPLKPENMNIYISNMKDKYLMVYDGTNWNLANKMEELDRLYEEKEMILEDWLESNPDPILKEKFVKYLNNKEKDECLNHIKEEIKLLLYNKGNQLIML